ncbi:MAG: arg [Bacillota bacterium]|nr:arg [Bacillota bacterium]
MKEKQLNLFYPQWQGAGAEKELLTGALEIKDKYLTAFNFIEVPVSDDDISPIENNILGYEQILGQLKKAKSIVSAESPDCIFTVGGGCDVEIIPVSYLNHILDGNLTVLWLDAHGDLNVPELSPSKCFHGMPLRTLLGDGNQEIINTLFSRLSTDQLILAGQRDLDEPEKNFIDEKKIEVISIDEINSSIDHVVNAIKAKQSENLYIHLDLDILDLNEFPHVMVPAPNGLKMEVLLDLLRLLDDQFNLVGLSLLEYTSSGEEENKVITEVIKLGVDLHGEQESVQRIHNIQGIPAIIYGAPSDKLYLYVHGKSGYKEEAESFAAIAGRAGFQVLSFDLPEHGERSEEKDMFNPWTVVLELRKIITFVKERWEQISIRANSIGAYFVLLALAEEPIERCLFVSPILDMEALIFKMMQRSEVTEEQLEKERVISTNIGETLSWDYLSYVRNHPILKWEAQTSILYGSEDHMTEQSTIDSFAAQYQCNLTIMNGGEHWFHTLEQFKFLENWEASSVASHL